MAAASDMTTATTGERGAMEEGRKGFLTVRNALVAFSVISGAVSFLSAFSPSVPIEWSATMKNLFVGYNVLFKEPLTELLAVLGLRLIPGSGDAVVYWMVFVIPTMGYHWSQAERKTYERRASQGMDVSLEESRWYTVVIAAAMLSVFPVVMLHDPQIGVLARVFDRILGGAAAFLGMGAPQLGVFLFGSSYLLGPLSDLIRARPNDDKSAVAVRGAVQVYGRILMVIVVGGAMLLANRVFIGYGY